MLPILGMGMVAIIIINIIIMPGPIALYSSCTFMRRRTEI